MQLGKGLRNRCYWGARALPDPVKRLGKVGLEGVARATAAVDRNRFPFRYRDEEIAYRYFDGPSLLYLANCLEDGQVAHEGIPIDLLDLPDRYDVAIDVGAHFGVYSVLLGVLNDVDLYCFEPNPRNRRILAANLAENDVDAVVDRRVVTDRTGSITFYQHDGFNTVSHSTEPPPELRDEFERTEVESVSLSSLFADRESVNVFVKLDAEGEEGRIVRDLLETEAIDELSGILEVHRDRLPDDGESLFATLEREWFEHRQVNSIGEPDYWFTNAADESESAPESVRVT